MRTDLELIYDWVPQGAHILDLACGDGVLLERLAQEKGVTGYGLRSTQTVSPSVWRAASTSSSTTWTMA